MWFEIDARQSLCSWSTEQFPQMGTLQAPCFFARSPPSRISTSLPVSSVACYCSYGSERNSSYSTGEPGTPSWAYGVLGLEPPCSATQLKAAFRSKVKQFHPDLMIKDGKKSDVMIRHVIQAYEILGTYSKSEIIERECMDPFDQPECEAFDLFVNEILCLGRGCQYSCVTTAPHAFKFSPETGTARATSQGHGDDYPVHLAVGQCPKNCIYYVTPSQRIILEELLHSILSMPPYDNSPDTDLLFSLIMKANYENKRYQPPRPKKDPKSSSSPYVDWS